jgi:NADH-quinone oxidoreductase subunit H
VIRCVLPRFRYDQLISLGWRVFVPITIGWTLFISCFLYVFVYESNLSEFLIIIEKK